MTAARRTTKPVVQPVAKVKPRRKATPKAPPLPKVETTQKAAAKRLGITDRQLRNWINDEAGFPNCKNGYDIAAIQEWQEERGRKGSSKNEEAASILMQTQETKLERWRIAKRREEIELAELEGTLMPRETIRELLSGLASLIREVCRELQRQGHAQAFEMIEEMLNRYESLVDQRIPRLTDVT